MGISIIDTLDPLGKFPAVKSEHVDVSGVRLNVVLDETAKELALKANKDYVDEQIASVPQPDVTKSYVDNNFAKKTDIPDVPKKTSQLQNDSGFLTQHQSLAEYAKKTDIPTAVSAFQNDAEYVNSQEFDTAIGIINSKTDNTARDVSLIKSDIKKLNPGVNVIFMPVEYYRDTNAPGDCTVFVTATLHKVIMIDTGSERSYAKIKHELRKADITHIDYFILTHYHGDHYGNINNLIDDGFIDSSTVSYLPKSAGVVVENWGDEDGVKSALTGIKTYPNEQTILAVDDVSIEFFNCSDADISYYDRTAPDCNNYSICCYVKFENTSILMTGDIQLAAQKRLCDNGYIQKCDILKIPHHAFETTIYDDFVFNAAARFGIASTSTYLAEKGQVRYSRFINALSGINCDSFCLGNGAVYVSVNQSLSLYHNGLPIHTRNDNVYQIHVNPNYTGETSIGTELRPFSDINSAAIFAASLNVSRTEIVFDREYTCYEDVFIRDVKSEIIVNGFRLNGTLNVQNCNVTLKNITCTSAKSRAIVISNCRGSMEGVKLETECKDEANPTNGRGIAIYRSLMYVRNCTVSNHSIPFAIYEESSVLCESVSGFNNDYLIWSGAGTKTQIIASSIEYNKPFAIDNTAAGTVTGIATRKDGETMRLVWKGDNVENEPVEAEIIFEGINRKNCIIYTSGGGIYTLTSWNNSISAPVTINESESFSIVSVVEAEKKMTISYTGLVNIYALM